MSIFIYIYQFQNQNQEKKTDLLLAPILAQIDDVSCTRENLDTLKIGGKIDDTIIHFLCALETHRFSQEYTLYKFVSPSVTQLLQRLETNKAAEVIESGSFLNYDIIFFPLSNLKGELLGHWSLLIWCRSMKNKFLHFDSLKNVNVVPAKQLTEKIVEGLKIKNYKFKNIKGPLQNNNTDCGVYLMATMDEIASSRKIADNLKSKITPEYITKFRIALSSCIIHYNSTFLGWEKYRHYLVD